MPSQIAKVVVSLPVEGPFDYFIPEALREKAAVGMRARVSFSRDVRTGYIIGLAEKSSFKKVKPILALLDSMPVLDERMLQFTRKFAGHYECSWGEAIETSLPDALRKGSTSEFNFPPGDGSSAPHPKGSGDILVHDPSGKNGWPFILDEIKRTLTGGAGVIVLVPEVDAVARITSRFKSGFSGEPAILDKRLSTKEELQHWVALRSGTSMLAVGTRSAIFAPVRNLGLIVICDEENPAYKQEQSPFYHVRRTAFLRGAVEGCRVLLASAAPSAESWSLAKSKRISLESFPAGEGCEMQVVDMNNYNPRKSSLLSVPLRNSMEKTLKEGGKIILFMNRKGFSTQTCCNQCGHIVKCPRCEINLTYLFSKKKMVCRLCQHAEEVPRVCPQCKSSYLRSTGMGIEKLESETARIFPGARVRHYDREAKNIPKDFDILITTQAIVGVREEVAVSLIGVIHFDSELHRLDFRSAQRAFSLLVHLRQIAKKKMIVQTRIPDNYCLKAVRKMDFKIFYREELKFRKELALPPYRAMVSLGLRSAKEENVFAEATALHTALQRGLPKGMEILDPHPDVIPKLRDKYRFTVILKGKTVEKMLVFLKKTLSHLKRKRAVILTVNADD